MSFLTRLFAGCLVFVCINMQAANAKDTDSKSHTKVINYKSFCKENKAQSSIKGTFTMSLLDMSTNPTQGIALGSPNTPVNYSVTILPGGNQARLRIDPFIITISDSSGNFIYAINPGLIPSGFAPASPRYINFPVNKSIIGHVFRDGSVRFSGPLNAPLPPGTYDIPATSVTYSICGLNLPVTPNHPIAQGQTNGVINESMFPSLPPSIGSINNLEYFTVLFNNRTIYAAWGDNSPQIKNQLEPIPNPDPYTRIAFATLDENGNYLISPINVGDLPVDQGPNLPPDTVHKTGAQMEVSMTMDPTNPLMLNMASWSIDNTNDSDPCSSNNKAFYAFSQDGGRSWTVRDLFIQNFVPRLQLAGLTGDHFMRYDAFGNLYYQALGAHYDTLPFTGGVMSGNMVPLPDVYFSTNNGQIFTEIANLTPIHLNAVGLDYPEGTTSQESDGQFAVFWLTMKQLATVEESFETGDSFPQLTYAFKTNGKGQFVSQHWIELPGTTNGGYGAMAAGKNGKAEDVAVTGLPVKLNYGALFQSNESIWFTHNAQGTSGSFNDIKFFANTNIGFRATIPPQPTRESWSQPNIAIDNNNRWFVAYVDTPTPTTSLPTQSDIWLIYSDDLGNSWSPPYKVNDVSTFTRYQPQIKVDPTTNNLLVAWLDARDNTNVPPSGAITVRPYFAVIPSGFFPKIKNLPTDFLSQPDSVFFNKKARHSNRNVKRLDRAFPRKKPFSLSNSSSQQSSLRTFNF